MSVIGKKNFETVVGAQALHIKHTLDLYSASLAWKLVAIFYNGFYIDSFQFHH